MIVPPYPIKLLAGISVSLLFGATTFAQTLFLDPSATDWDGSATNWSTNAVGPFDTAWSNGNVADFTPGAASTVTLGAAFNPAVTGIQTGAAAGGNLTIAADAGGNTIQVGASGINHQVSTNLLLSIEPDLELTATQTWSSTAANRNVTVTGNVDLGTNDLAITTNGANFALTGGLAGSGDLSITGGGATTLGGGLTGWTGDLSLSATNPASLRVDLDGPLNASTAIIITERAGIANVSGQDLTLNNAISVSSLGVFNNGVLRAQGAAALTLEGGISVTASGNAFATTTEATSTLNIDGGVNLDSSVGSGTATYRITGSGVTNLNSVVSDDSAGGSIAILVTQAASGVINSNAAHTYDGSTTIGSGTMAVDSINNSGSASAIGTNATVIFGVNFGSNSVGILEIANSSTSNRNLRFSASDVGSADTNGGGIDVAAGQTVEVSGQIQRGGDTTTAVARFEKRGDGTLNLTRVGSNTFDGQIFVQEGTLLVNTDLTAVTAVSGLETFVQVESGATLGGEGTVTEIRLLDGGIVAPGNSPGELTATSLVWDSGGTFSFELGSDNTTATSDLFTLTGALEKGVAGPAGSWLFNFTDGVGAPTLGETFTLINFDSQIGFITTDFGFTYTGTLPSLGGTFSLSGSALQFTVDTIPEPGSALLFLLGAVGLCLRRRRVERVG